MIALDPFPYELAGLSRSLSRVSERYGFQEEKVFDLIGPLRVYSADPAEFVDSGGEKVAAVGWRGLVINKDRALAAVQIATSPLQSIPGIRAGVNLGLRLGLGLGAPRYAIFGKKTTALLSRAMQVAQDQAGEGGPSFLARFLILPSIFVSAIWLSHENQSLYVAIDDAAGDTLGGARDTQRFVALVRDKLMKRTDAGEPQETTLQESALSPTSAPGPSLRAWRARQ